MNQAMFEDLYSELHRIADTLQRIEQLLQFQTIEGGNPADLDKVIRDTLQKTLKEMGGGAARNEVKHDTRTITATLKGEDGITATAERAVPRPQPKADYTPPVIEGKPAQALAAETGHAVVQTGDNPPTFVETEKPAADAKPAPKGKK